MIYKSYLIEKDFKSIGTNIALFYGENIGLQNDFKDIIKYKNSDASIVKFEQDNIIKDPETFLNELLNFSLFEKKKIFIINNVNDKILSTIQELEKKIENQKIYLFSGILDKKSKLRNYFEKSNEFGIVPCYLDNEINLKNIILNKLNGFKGLSADNLNLIIQNCNLDRVKLNNELDKIKVFFVNKVLDKENLLQLLNLELHDDFNLLKDEAIKGNKIKTNTLLNNTIIESDKSAFYLALLNQRFAKLSEIHKLTKNNDINQTLNNIKPPIFWKDKPVITQQIKKWNEKNINKILRNIYNIEIKTKTESSINNNILIKKLIVDICNLASA